MNTTRTLFLGIFLVSSVFRPSLAKADEKELTIQGAPGAIAAIKGKLEALEKITGRKIKLDTQDPAKVMPALQKKLVEGLAIGGSATDFFELPDIKGGGFGKADDYEWLTFGGTTVMAVLHPDNPVTSLSKEQIAGLLSGKTKNWLALKGKNFPVKVVINKAQVATMLLIPRFFLGKDKMDNVDYVTTLRGVVGKITESPGTIAFSGSKFEEAGVKPKFIDTDAKITYVLGSKKPLTPEMKKVFEELTPK